MLTIKNPTRRRVDLQIPIQTYRNRTLAEISRGICAGRIVIEAGTDESIIDSELETELLAQRAALEAAGLVLVVEG